jgi:hypothetical protein
MRFSNGTVSLFFSTVILATQSEESSTEQPDDATNHDHADSGILSPRIAIAAGSDIGNMSPRSRRSVLKNKSTRRGLQATTTASPTSFPTPVAQRCSQGYVDCVNGFVKGSITTTCAAACGVNCCRGTNACNSFTGKICKDGSCDGERACQFANIPSVVNSCRGGVTACYRVGKQGTVGKFVNACNGTRNCYDLGYKGIVGNVQDSCYGVESCSRLGQDGAVGNVQNSCNGGEFACFKVGEYFGAVGDILDSCHGFQSCFLLGKLGTVGNVLNSCNAPTSCLFLTRMKGTAGNLLHSCNGVDACNRGASYGGSMKSISSSCNAHHACKHAGRGLTYPLHISSNMNNCCNTPYECYWANQTSLPDECQAVRA